MKIRPFPLACAMLLATAPVMEAQERWSLEVTGGPAFATKDLGDAELGTGLGFEGSLGYRVMPHLWIYGGWDWHRFSADDSFAGSEVDFEETGYAYGFRFEHPFSGESVGPAYRVHAGPTYNHIEVENEDGDLTGDSGHGTGWEAGAGLALPFSDGWRLTPGARYRALSRDIEIGTTMIPVDLSYLTLELGIARVF